jgi:hypothetical protein
MSFARCGKLGYFGFMDVIERWQAVQQINTGIACTVEYVEADRKRGTGGKLVKLVNWARLTKDVGANGVAGIYQATETFARQRNTLDNEIIMMYDPDNTMKHPKPVHYWLLCSFNGKRIV